MKETVSNLKTEIVMSNDETKRYSLRKVWDENKPSLAIVMICPSSSGEVSVDTSTALTMANCYRLGYGAVTIVNLFSKINDFAFKEAEEIDEENLKAILKAAEENSCLVLAWGTGKAKNKAFQRRVEQVVTALRFYEEKLYCLCDEKGGSRGLHPLSPRLRVWYLSPVKIRELVELPSEKESEQKKKPKVKNLTNEKNND